MNVSAPPKFGMGASPRRIEDGSLIRGKGRYTTDVTPEGTLTAYVLRSTVAHARIKVGDLSAARAAPGVHLVWTGGGRDATSGSMPCLAQGPAKAPSSRTPPYPVLCGDTVRHVGDAIAFIVADDLNSAKSAAELIEVDYDTLPAITDTAARARCRTRRSSGRSAGRNLALRIRASATRRRPMRRSPRPRRSPSSPSSTTASSATTWSRARSSSNTTRATAYTVTVGSQGVHGLRDALCKVLKVDPKTHARPHPGRRRRLRHQGLQLPRISAGGEGGRRRSAGRSNGSPTAPSISSPTRTDATMSRPARWRSTPNGRILALRVDITANMGSYFNQFGADHSVVRGRHDDRRLRHPDRPCGLQGRLHAHRSDRRLSRRRAARRRRS